MNNTLLFNSSRSSPPRTRGISLAVYTLAILVVSASCANAKQSADAEQLYSSQPTVTPELSSLGTYTVGVKTLEITNPDQLSGSNPLERKDRTLTLEVWYPTSEEKPSSRPPALYLDQTRSGENFKLQGKAYRDAAPLVSDEKFPLVVFSHGYTGYRSILFYLGEHLASHGYVVASIDHTDSTNTEIDFAANPGAGFLSTLIHRSRDQQFVLDAMSGESIKLSSMVDSNNSGLLGYSMGGYGALNTVGGCYEFPEAMLSSFSPDPSAIPAMAELLNICQAGRDTKDERWKAVVPIAPWGGEPGVHKSASLAQIEIPMLFIAGELDDVSGFENGVSKLFSQTQGSNKYMLVYENARHNIAAHPAPQVAFKNDLDIGHYFEPAWSTETINRINQHMVLAFLDCYLKSNDAACAYLPMRESSDQIKQADGKLTQTWPGFKDRWATGLRFIRGTE